MYKLVGPVAALLLPVSAFLAGQQPPHPSPLAPAAARQLAVQYLKEALQAASATSLPPQMQAALLGDLAAEFYKAGDSADSASTLSQALALSIPMPRLSPRAPAKVQQRFLNQEPGQRQGLVHAQIARAQVASGNLEGARQAIATMIQDASGIGDPSQRVTLIQEAGQLQLKMGDIQGAAQTAGLLPPERGFLTEVQSEQALAHVRAGDLPGALSMAREAPGYAANALLKKIVETQISAGDLAGAAEVAASIPNNDFGNKVAALASLAVAQAQAGDRPSAQATLASASKLAGQQEFSLFQIAEAQAKMGDFAAAVTTIDSHPDSKPPGPDNAQKPRELVRIGTMAGKAGNRKLAQDCFRRALALAFQSSDATYVGGIVQEAASAQVEIDDIDGAMKTLEDVAPGMQDGVINKIIIKRAQAGDIAGAEQMAAQLHPPFDKSVLEIEKAKARQGDFAGALLTAPSMNTILADQLFREEVKRGSLEMAVAALPGLQESVRPRALLGIAQGLLEAAGPADGNSPASSTP